MEAWASGSGAGSAAGAAAWLAGSRITASLGEVPWSSGSVWGRIFPEHYDAREHEQTPPCERGQGQELKFEVQEQVVDP